MSVYRCPQCEKRLDEFGICPKCEIIFDLDDLIPQEDFWETSRRLKEMDEILDGE